MERTLFLRIRLEKEDLMKRRQTEHPRSPTDEISGAPDSPVAAETQPLPADHPLIAVSLRIHGGTFRSYHR
jgi:hypothetical protein